MALRVTAAGGIALRYGIFYGAANDGLIWPVRKRQFPTVGDGGGITLDPEFYVDFGPHYGAHQVRLQGGDCSTDSFCYPSA